MNWTDEQKVSEFIALLMGKCWHELSPYETNELLLGECIHCEEIILWYWEYKPERRVPCQFNAFTPDGIWEWKEFMERELPDVWERYLDWIYSNVDVVDYSKMFLTEVMRRLLNPSNFAQYMADHVEVWGYDECPDKCEATDGGCYCPGKFHCGGAGKTINPKFAKVVEWIEKEEK